MKCFPQSVGCVDLPPGWMRRLLGVGVGAAGAATAFAGGWRDGGAVAGGLVWGGGARGGVGFDGAATTATARRLGLGGSLFGAIVGERVGAIGVRRFGAIVGCRSLGGAAGGLLAVAARGRRLVAATVGLGQGLVGGLFGAYGQADFG